MEHQYMAIPIIILILLLFLTGFLWQAIDEPPSKPVVGGQCKYRKYRGLAQIVCIRKRGVRNKDYEVRFSFHTDEIVKERHGHVEGKEYLLLLENSTYPGPEFLRKYGIEVGKHFNCYLKVITRGTCTPVLFDFPTIDLGDYFENQK